MFCFSKAATLSPLKALKKILCTVTTLHQTAQIQLASTIVDIKKHLTINYTDSSLGEHCFLQVARNTTLWDSGDSL